MDWSTLFATIMYQDLSSFLKTAHKAYVIIGCIHNRHIAHCMYVIDPTIFLTAAALPFSKPYIPVPVQSLGVKVFVYSFFLLVCLLVDCSCCSNTLATAWFTSLTMFSNSWAS